MVGIWRTYLRRYNLAFARPNITGTKNNIILIIRFQEDLVFLVMTLVDLSVDKEIHL